MLVDHLVPTVLCDAVGLVAGVLLTFRGWPLTFVVPHSKGDGKAGGLASRWACQWHGAPSVLNIRTSLGFCL